MILEFTCRASANPNPLRILVQELLLRYLGVIVQQLSSHYSTSRSASTQQVNRKIRATHKSFLSDFKKYFPNKVRTCKKALNGNPLAEFRIHTLNP